MKKSRRTDQTNANMIEANPKAQALPAGFIRQKTSITEVGMFI